MGFKREKKVFKLVWPEGHENHGLVVKATSCPLGDFLRIANMAKFVSEENADAEQISELFKTFAYCLIGWNLEDDDDKPVPATIDGLYKQDLDFVMAIINAWVGAISQIQEDEGKGSASGERFPEASIPMEAL